MVAGSLNCPVPVNLLLRAVTEAIPGLNLSLIGELFGDLDLLRWKWAISQTRARYSSLRQVTDQRADDICRVKGSLGSNTRCVIEAKYTSSPAVPNRSKACKTSIPPRTGKEGSLADGFNGSACKPAREAWSHHKKTQPHRMHHGFGPARGVQLLKDGSHMEFDGMG